MATRKVPVLPQTGRPGQIDNELIQLWSMVTRLGYDAAHLGASTMPDTFLPNTADFTGSLGSTAALYQLLGIRLPFVCRSIGAALKTTTNGRCRFGIYRVSREELDSTGRVVAVKMSETSVVTPTTSWADYKMALDRDVSITLDSIWFLAAKRDGDLGGVDIPGINFSTGVLGRPASAVFSAVGSQSGGLEFPGSLGPVVDAGADNVSATNLVDDFQQAPDDVDRSIILAHALSRTAERLSWNAY